MSYHEYAEELHNPKGTISPEATCQPAHVSCAKMAGSLRGITAQAQRLLDRIREGDHIPSTCKDTAGTAQAVPDPSLQQVLRELPQALDAHKFEMYEILNAIEVALFDE